MSEMQCETRAWGILTALVVSFSALTSPARALEEPADEWDTLKGCEKRLCTMILGRKPEGSDLKCAIAKTWAQSSLKGGENKGVSWVFGDARCAVDLTLSRADLMKALTLPKHTVKIPQHTVKCVVERDEQVKPVTIKLAPKLEFKNGKADKVWINLKEIEGPDDVKGTVWVAAGLEDKLGIFHKPMIKSINKFMYQQCAKRYGPDAAANDDEKRKDKPASEAAKANDKPATTAKATASAP
jgi:hypothetical protein